MRYIYYIIMFNNILTNFYKNNLKTDFICKIKETNLMNIGKKIRLERIFNRKTRRTVIAPMDHGVSSGPIKGIIDMDKTVESISRGGANNCSPGTQGIRSGHRTHRPPLSKHIIKP